MAEKKLVVVLIQWWMAVARSKNRLIYDVKRDMYDSYAWDMVVIFALVLAGYV